MQAGELGEIRPFLDALAQREQALARIGFRQPVACAQQDVAHLGRLRQRMEVRGRRGIPGSSGGLAGRRGRSPPGSPVSVGRGGPPEARPGPPRGQGLRGVRVLGWC